MFSVILFVVPCENFGKLTLDMSTFRFSDLTGTDYSEGAISLAQSLAARDGFSNIKFLVSLNFKYAMNYISFGYIQIVQWLLKQPCTPFFIAMCVCTISD